MDDRVERRVADERHRLDISQRLAALEVSQKLYHDELKSICENLHVQLTKMETDVATVKSTLYGGPNNKIGLLGKMFIATTAVIFIGGFFFRPVEQVFDRFVLKKIGEDSTAQMVQESTKKRVQLFNRKTGEYEYFIEYKPVQKKRESEENHD